MKKNNSILMTIHAICTYFLVFVSYILISFSSPFYPTNPWVDTNAMLSVARSWLHGLLPFQDIFEQRGPTMYFIYLIGARLSENNFLGVFVLELLFGMVSFYLLVKIAKLFLGERPINYWVALVGFSTFIFNSAFRFGGSPEEFSIPFLLGLLYFVFYHYKHHEKFTSIGVFIQGMLFSFVFWMKYSLVGAWIGFFLFLGISILLEKNFQRFFKIVGSALAGFLLITLPIFVYFGVHQALGDLFYTYFQTNLSSYTTNATGLEKVSLIGRALGHNVLPHWTSAVVIIVGIIWLLTTKIQWKIKSFFISIIGFELFFVYFSGHPYKYYFLPFSAFVMVVIVLILVSILLHHKLKRMRYVVFALVTAAILFVSMDSVFSTTSPEKTLMNNRVDCTREVAKKMKEMKRGSETTLLQIGDIDEGFYLASGTYPITKYFENPNIPYDRFPAICDGQMKSIQEKAVEFVIVTPYKRPFRSFVKAKPELFGANNFPKILLKNYVQIPLGKKITEEGYALFQRR